MSERGLSSGKEYVSNLNFAGQIAASVVGKFATLVSGGIGTTFAASEHLRLQNGELANYSPYIELPLRLFVAGSSITLAGATLLFSIYADRELIEKYSALAMNLITSGLNITLENLDSPSDK